MELKLLNPENADKYVLLLIVPYGIETNKVLLLLLVLLLLIVPYGIETIY